MSDTLWGIPTSITQPFDTAYWLSFPPEVQALQSLSAGSQERETAAEAVALAGKAYIDVPIHVWGWSPYLTMLIRQSAGYTWIPNALQANVPTVPGADLPGLTPYDPKNPPPGSIKVSTNIADFPPFTPQLPTTPATSEPLVGALMFGNVYAYGPGVWSSTTPKVWIVTNGQLVQQDGSTYKAVVNTGFMGPQLHFEKQ